MNILNKVKFCTAKLKTDSRRYRLLAEALKFSVENGFSVNGEGMDDIYQLADFFETMAENIENCPGDTERLESEILLKTETSFYEVILSELRNEGEPEEYIPGYRLGAFLTYEEAFSFVGYQMENDIKEFGRADVYQIMYLDNYGEVFKVETLDNETLNPPCRKPTYPIYGCQGCLECKEEVHEKVLCCPNECPWFDGTTKGCQGCSKLSDCLMYEYLENIENPLSSADKAALERIIPEHEIPF